MDQESVPTNEANSTGRLDLPLIQQHSLLATVAERFLFRIYRKLTHLARSRRLAIIALSGALPAG